MKDIFEFARSFEEIEIGREERGRDERFDLPGGP
jgi:hypothetical protein